MLIQVDTKLDGAGYGVGQRRFGCGKRELHVFVVVVNKLEAAQNK